MVDNMDEVIAELQREKQKNAELLQRISALEAQIQQHETEKDSSSPFMDHIGQDNHHKSTEQRSSKKIKRQKTKTSAEKLESTMKIDDTQSLKDSKLDKSLVSWMSMDDTQLPLLVDKSKDVESILECKDTDDSDDEDEPCTNEDTQSIYAENIKDDANEGGFIDKTMHMNSQRNQNEIEFQSMNQKPDKQLEEVKKFKEFRSLSLQRKPPKVAFCPKEVKTILESQVLDMKNAQSHTMRKIIVFASLGIRHGCDDMYELDFNHFSISRKGDPYMSHTNRGEHVLYEKPGVKRKVFYRNHSNPNLCPVQILEEEQAMRPSDASSPSCLFLCIKYGGKTRNIPQNEYVRQRMGRNKLKSFGPLICMMAKLVNIRTGSFFFKALGITLLFMAGFPDDIVQTETNYRKLDLFQKYYRTDEDAAGEELFLANPSTSELANPDKTKPKSNTQKSKGKKQTENSTINKISGTQQATIPPDATFQTMVNSLKPHMLYNRHPLCPMLLQPRPVNAMTPLMYWPSVQNAAYPTWPHPSTFGYQSLEGIYGGHQMLSVHPWLPYYNQGLGSRVAVDSNEVAITESASSSCSTEPK